MNLWFWSSLILSLGFLLIVIFWRDRKVLSWIREQTHPERRRPVSGYFWFPQWLHFLLFAVMAIVLLMASIRSDRDRGNIIHEKSAPLLLFLDASMSMYSGDTFRKAEDLLDEQKQIAASLIEELPDYKIGLYSFSGRVATHTPPTTDHAYLPEAIRYISHHGYRNMGSNFKEVLREILRYEKKHPEKIFAVIMSDGDSPLAEEKNIKNELKKLAKTRVKIFCIGLASKKGRKISLFKMEDVLEGKAEPQIAKTVTVKRVDKTLKQIAESTGGRYFILEKDDDPLEIARIIRAESPPETAPATTAQKEKAESLPFGWLLFFVLLFLLDTLILQNFSALSKITSRESTFRNLIRGFWRPK